MSNQEPSMQEVTDASHWVDQLNLAPLTAYTEGYASEGGDLAALRSFCVEQVRRLHSTEGNDRSLAIFLGAILEQIWEETLICSSGEWEWMGTGLDNASNSEAQYT